MIMETRQTQKFFLAFALPKAFTSILLMMLGWVGGTNNVANDFLLSVLSSRMRLSVFRGAIADGGRATPRPRHRIARSGPEVIARAPKSKGNCSRRGASQVPHHQTD